MAKFSSPKASADDSILDEGEVIAEGEARPYQTKVAPAPPAPPAFDMAQFAQMLASALAQSGTEQAQVLREALTGAAAIAREPIPENKVHPDVSVYNPLGERDNPNPGLRCPMFIGQYDDTGKVAAAWEYINTTRAEQEALNGIQPGAYTVTRNDGIIGRLVVDERKDSTGETNRLVFAFPHGWLGRDQQMHLIGPLAIARQIAEQTRAA